MEEPANHNPWKWGFIYYNPDDSRVWVPKRTGLGWTFNFAQPLSYVWLVAIIGAVFLIRYAIKRLS